MFRCVSETLPELIEKNENPLVGVILVIVIFTAIGLYVTLSKILQCDDKKG